MFSRPKLLVLGFLPGAITFALASAIVYFAWEWFLQGYPLWVSLGAMIALFLLSWICIGGLSLAPLADWIVDECQRAHWGEVRLPAPNFRLGFLLRELFYSLVLFFFGIGLLILSLFPLFAPIAFVILAWLSAYNFLSPLYARKAGTASDRVREFFRNGLSNLILGMFLNLLLFLPIINVFLLGYAQVLAALLFLRRERSLAER